MQESANLLKLSAIPELSEQLLILYRAVESARNGIIVTDPRKPDNPIVYSNPGFSEITGYKNDEILGKNCRFLQGPDVQQPAIEEIRKAVRETRSVTTLLRNYKKDGTPFWNELTISPVFDAKGTLINFIGVQNDVTVRVDTERRIADFYSAISHELKTPVSCISGALGAMEDGSSGKITRATARLVELALANCDRLSALIDEVLDWKKLEAGRFQIAKRDTTAHEMLSHAVTDMFALANSAGQKLTLVPKDDCVVHCDPHRIVQVLENLISNAIKYASPGSGIELEVEKCDDGFIAFNVIDHGPGIPSTHRADLFKQFSQLPETAASRKGTGLGLAISKSIVELHGGQIGVKDTAGGGSTFWFKLPCR